MSKKMLLAASLQDAASRLDGVNLLTDPTPQLNLDAAYQAALAVWKEESLFGKYTTDKGKVRLRLASERKQLRLSALTVRQIGDQLKSNGRVGEEDNKALRRVSEAFREVSAKFKMPEERAHPQMRHSVVGLRMFSMKELAAVSPFIEVPLVPEHSVPVIASDVDAPIDYMRKFDALHTKLPCKIDSNHAFSVSKMPVIIITTRPINTNVLDRSGLKGTQIKAGRPLRGNDDPGVMHGKLSGESRNTLVLEEQIVVGMRSDEVRDRVAARATKFISDRFGEYVNPLYDKESEYFRTPGNPLTFMLLINAHALAQIKGFDIKSVAFPWSSPEGYEQRTERLSSHKEELQKLEEQQAVLVKQKKGLQPSLLNRMSELREELDRDSRQKVVTPEEKQARLNKLKQLLEQEMQDKHGVLLTQLKDAQNALKAAQTGVRLGKMTTGDVRKALKAVKLMESVVAEQRSLLAIKYRGK